MVAEFTSPEPAYPRIGGLGWMRVVLRGSVLGIITFGGLAVLLLVRLAEAPLCAPNRPITPYITQFVCKTAFRILGIGFEIKGRAEKTALMSVANHTSWLDIFALNAHSDIYFVSKSEVAGWPGIGWLARATGTVFIERKREQAVQHTQVLQQRIAAGHHLLFFPEGTSSDGQQVFPFKPTLFQSAFALQNGDLKIQPITARYDAPPNYDARFYGWWGDMDFAPHLLHTLAPAKQGRVQITFHPAVRVADFADRKALAKYLEGQVRAGLTP